MLTSFRNLPRSVPLDRGRLVIGTAQLTQPYGLYSSRAARDAAADMLQFAVSNGVRSFDTAALYGDAELELGRLMSRTSGIEVVTKCAHLPADAADKASLIEQSVRGSLQRLGLDQLPVFLLHNASAFDSEVARKLDSLRAAGLVTRAGVSVYSGGEIDRVTASWSPDVIQIPLNIFDQRLIASGYIAALRKRGIEVHARSAFLQGVLLADPVTLPPWLHGMRDTLRIFIDAAGSSTADRAAACLGFVAQVEGVDRVVIGAQNRQQLQELLNAADRAFYPDDPSRFAINEPALVDPSRWPC